jgi:DNA helicase TIP49 (TBP-interacting protein)
MEQPRASSRVSIVVNGVAGPARHAHVVMGIGLEFIGRLVAGLAFLISGFRRHLAHGVIQMFFDSDMTGRALLMAGFQSVGRLGVAHGALVIVGRECWREDQSQSGNNTKQEQVSFHETILQLDIGLIVRHYLPGN